MLGGEGQTVEIGTDGVGKSRCGSMALPSFPSPPRTTVFCWLKAAASAAVIAFLVALREETVGEKIRALGMRPADV
jgi:hypothetical protein